MLLDEVKRKQGIASNPEYSIWTSASAGSGKTTVLVNRLLRMLLSGIKPSKILCITFTNTGAVTMKNRINDKLAEWAVFSDSKLEEEIVKLEGNEDKLKEKIKIARTLFAKILDHSNDFKILTIHSFCQQIIKRFPLEAGIVPSFQIADEIVSEELLSKAKEKILGIDKDDVRESIKYVFSNINEDQFIGLLKKAIGQKDSLLYFKNRFFTIEGIGNKLREVFNIGNISSFDEIEAEFKKHICQFSMTNDIIESVNEKSSEFDVKFIKIFQKFKEDKSYFKEYVDCFLTSAGSITKRLLSKKMASTFPDFDEFIKNEVELILKFKEDSGNFINFKFTLSFLTIVYEIFNIYDDLKKSKGLLDYGDLIFETSKLLNNSKFRNLFGDNCFSSWINYKLDEGLDHLLIDEAQDTSPTQWDIVKSLTDEFFAGYGQRGEENRTIFVVGDEKQSIFSFQGAEPKNFDLMLKYYKNSIESCGKKFENIYLETSFRSLKSILNIADEAFKDPRRKEAISKAPNQIKHNVVRDCGIGKVEVWPLIKEEEKEDKKDVDYWGNNYLESDIELTKKQKLAETIAKEIESWFKNGKTIFSRKDGKERLLKYSDIMILVKSRNKDFINYLIRQFNKRNIMTMGNDKFDLTDSIISQDILALLKFLIFRDDNLNFANLFKSPFLSLTENDLYLLCEYKNKNSKTLWQSINDLDQYKEQVDFLNDLINKSKSCSIYELLFYIFEIKGMRKKIKERFRYLADEVIDEFLSLSSAYEKNHNNSTILNFVYFIENTEIKIKRDMEQSNDEVKIMTVHSSKGLEAPIVILPDTNHNGGKINKIDKFLFSEQPGDNFEIPLLNLKSSNFIDNIVNEEKNKAENEYLRLLYVAITRAENELYVCDCESGKNSKPNDGNWYQIIKSALENSGAKVRKSDNIEGDILYVGDLDKFTNQKYQILENKNNEKVKKLLEELSRDMVGVKEIKIINPSLYYAENMQTSPQDNSDNLEKGKLVHKLLEILPEAIPAEWSDIMEIYLKNKSYKDEVAEIVLNVLNNNEFKFLFDKNSKAEVPIFGEVDGDLISGQIDRMSILDDKIYIVDYKNTNSIPNYVPIKYVKQLVLYKALLKKIYPNKEIISFILWTSFGKIDRVD